LKNQEIHNIVSLKVLFQKIMFDGIKLKISFWYFDDFEYSGK